MCAAGPPSGGKPLGRDTRRASLRFSSGGPGARGVNMGFKAGSIIALSPQHLSREYLRRGANWEGPAGKKPGNPSQLKLAKAFREGGTG